MNITIRIAFRNLIRQKRRNILLGIAMAFGVIILVISNSFARGISDTLLNKIIVNLTGHIDLTMAENGSKWKTVIRDRSRMEALVTQNIQGIIELRENASTFCRAIGNGKSDNIALVGIKPNQSFFDWVKLKSGNADDFTRQTIENPIILSETKAKYLNVQLHDTLRIRFRNIFGQEQTAALKIIGISKSQNMFMDMAAFVELQHIKSLLGYRAYESSSLQMILKKPLTAIQQATTLHRVLTPNLAIIEGFACTANTSYPATFLSFKRDPISIGILTQNMIIVSGNLQEITSKEGVMLHENLARALSLNIGNNFTMVYTNKFEPGTTTVTYTINGFFTLRNKVNSSDKWVLLSDQLFYKTYYSYLPMNANIYPIASTDTTYAIYQAIGPEWNRYFRTQTSETYQKKIKDFSRIKSPISGLDVTSMYETASSVLSLEKALNLMTFIAVMILFFIILIGVINTLRMSIRERTREIGTIRAIGMQRNTVRNIFIIETGLLALLSSIVGVMVGLLIIAGLSLITLHAEGPMNILLVNNHLHFVPSATAIIFNIVIIFLIAIVTAFFPANRAANLSASAALRHYE